MRAPMTKRRTITILAGLLALCGLSYYRLSLQEGATEAPLAQQDASEGTPSPSAPPKADSTSEQASSAALSQTELLRTEGFGEIMGTTYKFVYRRPANVDPAQIETQVAQALQEVDQRMSTYKEQSELSRLNRSEVGEGFALSDELLFLLQLSRSLSAKTQGAFDISIGPLINLWGFGPEKEGALPSAAQINAARAAVGPDKWKLDAEGATATRLHPGVMLDLSAIAKGYGTDRAAQALLKAGISNFMVEVGGEIRVQGQKVKKNGELSDWTLGIEAPIQGERQLYGILDLTGDALATSGDYRNYRNTEDGVVSHTFDPRSGSPTPNRTASVSVVRPTAAEADALATALGVLTPSEAIALANDNGWAVLLLERTQDGVKPHKSLAFEQLKYRQIKE